MRDDPELLDHILNHIDHGTTDVGDEEWLEPVDNYRTQERFDAERRLMRRLPVVICPAAMLKEPGSYFARNVAGIPLVVSRDLDGGLYAFRNACRHRGMKVAKGAACSKVFICNYHGWAYRLNGDLEYVPHEKGFPTLEKSANGLTPIHDVRVVNGLVFVTIDEPVTDGALSGLPDLLTDDQIVFDTGEYVEDTNWKLAAEGTLEGYHIKRTHTKSFFPYGYDNLNVIETSGPNVRVCFPFRRIEELREAPREGLRLDRMVTQVNRIFPCASITRLSHHFNVTLSEPETPTRTRYYNFRMTLALPGGKGSNAEALAKAKKDVAFLTDEGNQEDAAVVGGIQAALDSEANEYFRFGKYESAIAHFHKQLHSYLALMDS